MFKKVKLAFRSIGKISINLKRLLEIAWVESPGITAGYYATAGVSAFFPILISYLYKLLIDALVEAQNIETTIPLVLIAILGSRYIVEFVWDFVGSGLRGLYYDFLFRYKIQNALNYRFFGKVSNLDIAHFEDDKTLDLIIKAEDTFSWRPPNFLRQFSNLLNNFIAYISSFIILLPYGFGVPFLVSLVVIPRLSLSTRYGRLQWSIYGAGTPQLRKLWYFRWLLSNRESVTELRIFRANNTLLSRFKKIQDYLYKINKEPVAKYLRASVLPKALEIFVVGVFAFWKLPLVLSGEVSIGDFTFFISLLDRLTNSASSMLLNIGDIYENNLYVEHFFEVLDLPRLVEMPADPTPIPNNPYPPKIEFKNVSFSYPGNKKKVLKGVSFEINPGENIAFVGANGAGKTTIVKLICRFYDTTQGEILINGVNIKNISIDDWYGYLGTLFQSFMHYDLTAAENILLGSPDEKNKEKMVAAARASGADEFINELPKKYNQILGRQFEGGVDLSKGQWQKLAIARAFYEGAPFLILDEPTSAIDAEAEYKIFENLLKLYKSKSLFLISHRFSTVRNADKIYVLQNGMIVEHGDHKELMSKKGVYANMFEKQAVGYK